MVAAPSNDVKHMGRPSNVGQDAVPLASQYENQIAMTSVAPALA